MHLYSRRSDGNCATCDALKVDVLGGSKGKQFGGSNSSISDSYTLVGPGTIEISGSANRADEIITYQVTSSGSTCPSCTSILPIELIDFDAIRNDRFVELTWQTATEKNIAKCIYNQYFNFIRLKFDRYHKEYKEATEKKLISFMKDQHINPLDLF